MKQFLKKFLRESTIATKGRIIRKFEPVPRAVLILVLAVLIAVMLISVSIDGGAKKTASSVSGESAIVVATDMHYLAASLHDDGAAYKNITLNGDGKNILVMDGMLDAFFLPLKTIRPTS